jgi:signal transduction histidine kinase
MASPSAFSTVPAGEDSAFEASTFERALAARKPPRWIGWRRRVLVALALLGCVGLYALVHLLARAPQFDARWQPGPTGQPVLQSSADRQLEPLVGRSLVRLQADGQVVEFTGDLRLGSPRWTVDDELRARQVQARATLERLFESHVLTLVFDDGSRVQVQPRARGLAGLGLGFWLLAAPALMLFLIGAVVLLAAPTLGNALFALAAVCQSVSLLWLGIESGTMLAPVLPAAIDDLPWRLGLDLAIAAAAVHGFALYPRRLAKHAAFGAAAWAVAAGMTAIAASGELPGVWWWGQGTQLVLGGAALAVLSMSYRQEPNPFALIMRRLGVAALGTLVAVDVALVAADWRPALAEDVALSAVLVWTLFIASLMALAPFLSRTRRVLRELAMLAGLSTVAISLDLLFVSVFALEPFASLALAVFIALAAYALARHWMLEQVVGRPVMTTERTFEQLYRMAREVHKRPERRATLLSQLLRELFDPLEVLHVPRASDRSRVLASGSALVVPVHGRRSTPGAGSGLSLVLRFARHGQRLFTAEDARLTDRIVEQLRRAVAYDRAVERGRTEERLRIAQDLHDDIGARLLTLMYKAPDPEIEDYLRQTLKDLKTLTRGLAAASHRLSHAAAEWKADAQQRLTAAGIGLSWSFTFDEDVELSVVQWSSLTRVLRELISNTIHHARAAHVEIQASLNQGALSLRVADSGVGRNPASWSHGLGLGGVRKRVKQLGGQVRWLENEPAGIVCEVRVPAFQRPD